MPILIILALFIGIPVIEIAILIEIGGFIGVWLTIAIIISTAIAGTILLKIQGLSVLALAEQSIREGRPPVDMVIHGVFLLIAGVLLLTPGFATDAIGFALFVPPLRGWLGRTLIRALLARGSAHAFSGAFSEPSRARPQPPSPAPGIIDIEAIEVDDQPAARPDPFSPWHKED